MTRILIDKIKTYPDFPEKGVQFKDISPILEDPLVFQMLILMMKERVIEICGQPRYIAAIESRGFIMGAALAQSLNAGLLLVRKAGKLPGDVVSRTYDLEYGTATLEIHKGVLKTGDKVAIVDDVLATGGTAKAAAELINSEGGDIRGAFFIAEVSGLGGRAALRDFDKVNHRNLFPVDSIIEY